MSLPCTVGPYHIGRSSWTELLGGVFVGYTGTAAIIIVLQ